MHYDEAASKAEPILNVAIQAALVDDGVGIAHRSHRSLLFMTDINETKTNPQSGKAPRSVPRAVIVASMLVAACAAGAGATVLARKGHDVTYVALSPAPISTMHNRSQVALEGGVEETFGNKFVIQDASGRALVETGRAGEGRDLVTKDEKVVVQGRFDHGFVHAISIRHADGRTDSLDPPPPPHNPDPGEPLRPM